MLQRANAPQTAPPPRAGTVRQRVYLDLRRAIKQGTFKPGTRLPASQRPSTWGGHGVTVRPYALAGASCTRRGGVRMGLRVWPG